MKKIRFKNIHSLEDIQAARQHLKKKIRHAEKSFSDMTDLGKLFLNDNGKPGSFLNEDLMNPEVLFYLLPLGIKQILKLAGKKGNKKNLKRILIYSAAGSLLAFFVYKFLVKPQDEAES